MIVLVLLGAISILIWLGILLHPARPWDFQPVGDDEGARTEPIEWPPVCILVPARNESGSLPHTLPALLTQDYPGAFAVIVVDDRSNDGTADVAWRVAGQCKATDHLIVLRGAALPPGWVGKMWALAQGAAYCGLRTAEFGCENLNVEPETKNTCRLTFHPHYLLLTDADIHHTAGSLRRLIVESEDKHLALNSRMARLRCVSVAERLLIPAFVFFFNLLYPMRRVNDWQSKVAAAAGGCVLLTVDALRQIDGFACIKDRIIDDVSLAQEVKRAGLSIHLALSRHAVESLRVYESLGAIWLMVKRSAFTELRHSWLRLVAAVSGLVIMFLVPPLWTIAGIGFALAAVCGFISEAFSWAVVVAASGGAAWALMAVVYRPAVRFYGLSCLWLWTLPLAGTLYGAMTIDSALQHLAGKRAEWRDL